MSERLDYDYRCDIQETIRRIKAYTQAMTYECFLKDIKTQDAVIRNLEIIGEATKNLSLEMRRKYSDAPWKGMARIRDRLIHHYFGINLDIVWDIATIELPGLETMVEAILRKDYNG